MRFRQVLAIFALVGVVVPLIFLAVPGWAFVSDVQLYLWPPSILYLATDGANFSKVAGAIFETIVVLLNVPVYLLYGALAWLIFRVVSTRA